MSPEAGQAASSTLRSMSGDDPRVPELHVFKSSGPDRDSWRVWCATCGWEISGTGDTTARDVEARDHTCDGERA
jgi:hypothetical protein